MKKLEIRFELINFILYEYFFFDFKTREISRQIRQEKRQLDRQITRN
jgi:hypothetical protein